MRSAQIRQLALVELRKRVTAKKSKQWITQVPAVRSAIKGRLLEIIVSETSCAPPISFAAPPV